MSFGLSLEQILQQHGAPPAAPAPVHEHVWFHFIRQREPRVDVFDCRCGVRKKVYPGHDGQPEIVVMSQGEGGSISNCLMNVGDGNTFDNTLGDAQGSRLRALLS